MFAQQLHLQSCPLLVGIRIPSVGIFALRRVRRYFFSFELRRFLPYWLCDEAKLGFVCGLSLGLKRDVLNDAFLRIRFHQVFDAV